MRDTNQPFKKATAPHKAWSYRQLTEATEAQIHFHADFLRKLLARSPNDRLNHIHVSQVSGWAYGAFVLWQSMTQGWQDSSDEQRLRNLAESVEMAGSEHGGQA